MNQEKIEPLFKISFDIFICCSQVSLKELNDMFLPSYPDVFQVLPNPAVPVLVGCFIEMVDPVSHLTFPGELSPPLLELGSHHFVHRGDLLIVPVNKVV